MQNCAVPRHEAFVWRALCSLTENKRERERAETLSRFVCSRRRVEKPRDLQADESLPVLMIGKIGRIVSCTAGTGRSLRLQALPALWVLSKAKPTRLKAKTEARHPAGEASPRSPACQNYFIDKRRLLRGRSGGRQSQQTGRALRKPVSKEILPMAKFFAKAFLPIFDRQKRSPAATCKPFGLQPCDWI